MVSWRWVGRSNVWGGERRLKGLITHCRRKGKAGVPKRKASGRHANPRVGIAGVSRGEQAYADLPEKTILETGMPRVKAFCAHLIRSALGAMAVVAAVAAPATQTVYAQSVPSPVGGSAVRAPIGPGSDQVIGSLAGRLIYLSDLARAAKTLPEQMRSLPFETVMPVLLDRIIDHEALIMTARRAGLDKDPEVQRDMRAASEQVLEGAWLARVAPTKVTEAAILARYNRQFANRPATDEVRARHILVGSEQEAKSILEELKGGADFATIARVISKDPDGKSGGDLGFFRRDQVWPGFADAAFSLQPGQISPAPVHNAFGWHVIKVEERRLVAPPTLSEVHEQLRQELTAAAVQDSIAEARSQMIIHKFNLDGSELDVATQGR
jgi:peptidyl-prolyl cis-trans isomerase C